MGSKGFELHPEDEIARETACAKQSGDRQASHQAIVMHAHDQIDGADKGADSAQFFLPYRLEAPAVFDSLDPIENERQSACPDRATGAQYEQEEVKDIAH